MNRRQLHKSKFIDFQHWLIQQDVELLEDKGEWELLRWRSNKTRKLAIIFDNARKEHLTLNTNAEVWFELWKKFQNNL